MKNIIHTFSKTKLALSLSTILLLSACGGTDQDDGSVSIFKQIFSGLAIDGALARSTVYLDSNNNATRDPWEDSAFTDNDGYYSFNPKTQVDYCAEGTPDSEQIYCLRSVRSYVDIVVRIDGGYDLLTGEPFLGQMSRRVNMSEVTNSVDSIISPLTSLLTDVTSLEQRTNLLNSIGISENDLDVNYLDTNGNGGIDAGLLNASLKIHKTVTVLADRLNDHYSDLNTEVGVMNDPSAEVYANLAKELSDNASAGLDFVLRDSQALTRVLDNSETVLRELFMEKELHLPTDMGSLESPQKFTRVVEVSSNIASVVDQLINANDITINNAVGVARALEALIIKSVNEGNSNDSSIDHAINFLKSENNNLVSALTGALSSNLADISRLVGNDFFGDDFDTAEEVLQSASLEDSAQPFANIAGLSLKVSDLDLGFSPNRLDDSEVEFYFSGNSGDISGSFLACLKYIDDASIDGTLGEGNTRGELIDGFWSLLGADEDNAESYSLLLTLTFLGSTYQAILKSTGNETIEDNEYQVIRFDFDGDLKAYHSLNGFSDFTSIPASNEECQSRLPSRHVELD